MLRGCGDGFPKWWLLKAINESQLATPNNDNFCIIWVRLSLAVLGWHWLQLIEKEGMSTQLCHVLPLYCCLEVSVQP
jgi:hypothetical protein